MENGTDAAEREQRVHTLPSRNKLNDQANNRNTTNQESNGGRSREVTEVGLLQSKIVEFRKCGGENLFSDTAFYKDNYLRKQTTATRILVARGATS